MDKIREIAASGDAMAQEAIKVFDNARQSNDFKAALAFERNLLDISRDKFQFISPIEHSDLERLAEDRNRCAHPSKVSDTEVFEAPPELARLHIVNATKYVLSQPAAQGKRALDRLQAELDSNFFPAERADVAVFLKAGPLAKPRDSLLRGYISIILKRLIRNDPELKWEKRRQMINALYAASDLHPADWERLIEDQLGAMIPGLQDQNDMGRVVVLIGAEGCQSLWGHLDEAARLKLSTYVENLPEHLFSYVENFIETQDGPFRQSAITRINRSTIVELLDGIWYIAPELVISRAIRHMAFVKSDELADKYSRQLRSLLNDSEDAVKHLDVLAATTRKNVILQRCPAFVSTVKEFAIRKFEDLENAKELLRAAGFSDVADLI
ncbi:hypothetical protein ACNHE5_10805 [Pandoraea pnomenusa]|uniref:hypothetical protein n=1 Tax=Pandoraea pnomenusa TaxID=93220 RepID=UPI003CEB532C